MQFEYTLTAEDYIAFNAHAARVSEQLKMLAARQRTLCTVLVLVVVPVLIGVLVHDWTGGVVTGALASAATWFGYPHLSHWVTGRTLRRLAAHDGLGPAGTARLEIDDAGLREELAGTTTSISWDSVDRIDETAEHAFVFVTAVAGIIVPLREERSGELLAEVRARLADNRA